MEMQQLPSGMIVPVEKPKKPEREYGPLEPRRRRDAPAQRSLMNACHGDEFRPHLEPDQLLAAKDSEIASLKRRIEAMRIELAAWRDQFPEYKYKPKIGGFTFNDVIQNAMDWGE